MLDFDNFFKSLGISQSRNEAYNLCKSLQQTANIEGDIVEVGVYLGGSAQLLNKYKATNKKLYLFDTFEGWVDYCEKDSGGNISNGGCFVSNFESIKNIFKEYNVDVIKGYFPDSAPIGFENKRFSFIHLDVDTYTSTLKALAYFYDKINSGGIIALHDYINTDAPGVIKAANEFLSNKTEKVILSVDTQAMIIKT